MRFRVDFPYFSVATITVRRWCGTVNLSGLGFDGAGVVAACTGSPDQPTPNLPFYGDVIRSAAQGVVNCVVCTLAGHCGRMELAKTLCPQASKIGSTMHSESGARRTQDPIQASFTPADNRVRLSYWLPPQSGACLASASANAGSIFCGRCRSPSCCSSLAWLSPTRFGRSRVCRLLWCFICRSTVEVVPGIRTGG